MIPKRGNKQAQGFTNHYERRKAKGEVTIIAHPKHPNYNEEKERILLGLLVRGTLDVLGAGKWMLTKRIKIEHPTDKGYFKEVVVLTDNGKKLYQRKIREKKESEKHG